MNEKKVEKLGKRKLVLNREMLRELTNQEMKDVSGAVVAKRAQANAKGGSYSLLGTCSICWWFAEW